MSCITDSLQTVEFTLLHEFGFVGGKNGTHRSPWMVQVAVQETEAERGEERTLAKADRAKVRLPPRIGPYWRKPLSLCAPGDGGFKFLARHLRQNSRHPSYCSLCCDEKRAAARIPVLRVAAFDFCAAPFQR